MKTPILIKLGGSLITDKTKPLTARLRVIKRLSNEIHEARQQISEVLVIAHGGGSFPHKFADDYKTNLGIIDCESYKGISLVQNAAAILNRIVVKSLIEAGENAISIQPSSAIIAEDGRIKRWYMRPMQDMWMHNLLTVPYGDVAMDRVKGCCIISTEEILNFLARRLHSRRIILAGITDGVFTRDPRDPEAELIPEITNANYHDVRRYLSGSRGIDVTGGMLHKIDRIFELTEIGVEAEIINGMKEGYLKRTLLGESGLGTRIRS
jgi:isopentenyl phosphate kinase